MATAIPIGENIKVHFEVVAYMLLIIIFKVLTISYIIIKHNTFIEFF